MNVFDSSTLSLILAWLFCSVFFLYLIVSTFIFLFDVTKELPLIVTLWIAVCIVFVSPFRYMLLQLVLSEAYAVQSLRAFLSSILLFLYMPVVFALLYGPGRYDLPFTINQVPLGAFSSM